MTLIEFINEKYPITEKIRQLNNDPIKQIMENDDLPYDDIRYIDGELQKVVEITSDTYTPVLEILSYCKEDVEKMEDPDLKAAYAAYMDNIDITDMSISAIMSAASEYSDNRKRKEELLSKCTS